MTAAARSPISPRPATTTRFMTLLRAATRRSSPSSPGIASETDAQILASSAWTPSIELAREDHRSIGRPGSPASRTRSPPASYPAAIVRSAASAGRRAR